MHSAPDFSKCILVCLSATDDTKGKLVRFFTGNTYNHVSILYKSHFWGKWMTIQVDNNGVEIIPVYTLLKENMYNKFYRCGTDLSVGIRNNIDYIGRKYDFLGVLGIGLKIIIKKLFNKSVKNLLDVASKVFCTEYLIMVMNDSDFSGSDKIDPSLSEPDDIDAILSKDNSSVEVVVSNLNEFK